MIIMMNETEVGLKRHTEGRGNESRAMLGLSVGWLDSFIGTVEGWLGGDGF